MGVKTLANDYVRQVLKGEIVSCKYVELACRRWRRDVKRKDIYFNEKRASHALNFIETYCKHSKGEWAGTKISLGPWQIFIIANVFGWYRKSDRTRRFRQAYTEVGRKNGKSTFLSAIGLYSFIAEGEPGSEVYAAATGREQAKIVFDDAKKMVEASEEMPGLIGIHRNNMHFPKVGPTCKFMPLSRDAKTQDGLNPSAVIIDELHAHKTREVYDVLRSAMGARRQPLMFIITTAGFNQDGVCYEIRDQGVKILDQVIENDALFVLIFTLDEGDDWREEEFWPKANPNYGISVKPDDMLNMRNEALNMPAHKNNFLCKRLNIWTTAEVAWMNMEEWNKCNREVDFEKLKTVPCYAGLDLAQTRDITAFVVVWVLDGITYVYGKYYIPKDRIYERTIKDNAPYQSWMDRGLISATDGNVTDYDFLKRDIYEFAEQFNLQEIAFDRWGSTPLVNDLTNEGLKMAGFGQGWGSMNAPMKELDRIVASGRLAHGGDEPLKWMASNVVAKTDPAGNIKPDKDKAKEKIDGVVALIMAIGGFMEHEETMNIDDFINDPVVA